MKWTDVEDVADALEEAHPDVAILELRYTFLKKMILDLKEFDEEETGCNEKVLEAIQVAWLEIREDK